MAVRGLTVFPEEADWIQFLGGKEVTGSTAAQEMTTFRRDQITIPFMAEVIQTPFLATLAMIFWPVDREVIG